MCVQGSVVDELFLIERGVVKLTCAGEDGQETILDLRYPGQWVDQCAAVLQISHLVTATTSTRCGIYRCGFERFQELITSRLEALSLLMRQCASDWCHQAAMLTAMKTLSARERVCQVLTQMFPLLDIPAKGEIPARLPLKDHEFAALIGVSKQHFSMLKRQMLDAGELPGDDSLDTPSASR